MKRAKIIKKLSLAYWEVYAQKLNLAAAAKEWRDAGGKEVSKPLDRQVKKAQHMSLQHQKGHLSEAAMRSVICKTACVYPWQLTFPVVWG